MNRAEFFGMLGAVAAAPLGVAIAKDAGVLRLEPEHSPLAALMETKSTTVAYCNVAECWEFETLEQSIDRARADIYRWGAL